MEAALLGRLLPAADSMPLFSDEHDLGEPVAMQREREGERGWGRGEREPRDNGLCCSL